MSEKMRIVATFSNIANRCCWRFWISRKLWKLRIATPSHKCMKLIGSSFGLGRLWVEFQISKTWIAVREENQISDSHFRFHHKNSWVIITVNKYECCEKFYARSTNSNNSTLHIVKNWHLVSVNWAVFRPDQNGQHCWRCQSRNQLIYHVISSPSLT